MAGFFRLLLVTPALDFGPWATRPGRVARLEELVESADEDPYVTHILRPSGLRHEVQQVACVAGGRSWGHLCQRRRAEDGALEGRDLRLLGAGRAAPGGGAAGGRHAGGAGGGPGRG